MAARVAAMSFDDPEIKTPLHPYAKNGRPRRITHQHALYVVATGYVNPEGVKYDRHYCFCGECFRTTRTP